MGLHTAYVHRPLEWGPDEADSAEKPAESAYVIVADDFIELAEHLDASSIIQPQRGNPQPWGNT